MPTPDTTKHNTQHGDHNACYDRDLLREQITKLRKEAVLRSDLEQKIESKFKEETTRISTDSESKILKIQERCQTQITALNADFEKDKKRLEGQVVTQQIALDKQRKEREAQILREWEDIEKEKTDDLEFESLSAGESLAQQKEDTERKTSRLIESLAKTIEQIDNDFKKTQDKLIQWKVKSASLMSPGPQESALGNKDAEDSSHAGASSPPLPQGKELLEYFKNLINEIQDDAKAIKNLPSAYWAFADGITALVFVIPCVLSLLAAAGVAIPLHMNDSELPMITVYASAAAVTTLVLSLGAFLFWRFGKKKKARVELEKLVTEFSQKRQRLTDCQET